ncbi:MAG: RnfABCDGE type electron transport complex subunit D [Gammaproteobacteria bacterium]|nr:RnfABCDGE type electron transport complex subunit D [Gammaproteobacteria bacterium]
MAISPEPKFQTTGIMVRVLIALVPGTAVAVWAFGLRMIPVVVTATFAAVASEVVCIRSFKTIRDGSALVTGILIGLCMPPTVPFWIVAVGSLIGIGIGKHVYGGLGKNLFNPAMVGYVAVLVSFPEQLTHFDAVTGATVLEVVSHRGGSTLVELSGHPSIGFFGAAGYEWVNCAFLLGGAYLCVVRIISWHMPLAVLVGAALPTVLFYDGGSAASWGSPLFHLFAGGTMLTAFFIATDPVTSPSGRVPIWIYGLFVGIATMAIRKYGAWADGYAFAILLANILLPYIERRVPVAKAWNR